MSDMSLRPRSQRLSARATRLAAARSQQQRSTEVYPGLNDITDTFEAFPAEISRYFTLYKEIDAKFVSTLPVLLDIIAKFRTTQSQSKRLSLLTNMTSLLDDILPCLEEKMHVASIAADRTAYFMGKVNDDYEFIQKHEIPETIRFGQHNHPAIIHDTKIPDNKSAQTQRSESRREALAAKKAAHESNEDDGTPAPTTSGRGKGRPRAEKEGTPASSASTNGAAAKKRKTNNGGAAGTSNGNGNSLHQSAIAQQQAQQQHQQHQQHLQQQQQQQQLHQQHLQHLQHQQNFPNNMANGPTAHAQLLGNFTAQASVSVKEESTPRPDTPSGSKRARTSTKKKQEQQQQQALHEKEEGLYRDEEGLLRNSMGEMVYCYCNQVSYGEMVGCDDNDCKREWFHLPCTGLTTLPRGKWYCDECKQKRSKK